jgi:hypothetical protein
MQNVKGIEMLLELAGQVVQQQHGYWVETHAWRVEATPVVPHGIRYALTLHEPGGKRVLGYNNAHAAKPSGGFKYAGQVLPYDHKHHHVSDKGAPCAFKDAYQLLQDFFVDVDRILKEVEKT